MLWYKRVYQELEQTPNQDLFESEQGHYLLALGLSLFFYLLLLAFVFLEIPSQLKKTSKSVMPLGNDLLGNLPRRANPARVVSLPTPPRKSPAPAPVSVPIHRPEPIDPPVEQPVQQPPLSPAPIQPIPEPVGQPESTPIPINSARNGEVQGTQPEKILEPEAAPTPKPPTRQGRGAWFKKKTDTDTQLDPRIAQTGPVNYNRGPNTAFSQLEDISARQVTGQPVTSDSNGETPTYGSPFGSGKTISPEAVARNMEFELFATRLVQTICDTSRQQPLYTTRNPITPHTTTLAITVGRDRKILSVKFIHPSPHKILNDYIERVVYAVIAPQLPASWEKDQIIMPLSIDMRSSPGAGEIYFVPGNQR